MRLILVATVIACAGLAQTLTDRRGLEQRIRGHRGTSNAGYTEPARPFNFSVMDHGDAHTRHM
jgi:hypothetical protein